MDKTPLQMLRLLNDIQNSRSSVDERAIVTNSDKYKTISFMFSLREKYKHYGIKRHPTPYAEHPYTKKDTTSHNSALIFNKTAYPLTDDNLQVLTMPRRVLSGRQDIPEGLTKGQLQSFVDCLNRETFSEFLAGKSTKVVEWMLDRLKT